MATLEQVREVSVEVPAGVDTGHALRVRGEGEPGEMAQGDLYFVVNVERHPLFERRGDDIYVEQELDFTTAALGDEIRVPGLFGDLKVVVPEGTQPGAVLKLPGQGMPHLRGRGRGDQYVIVRVMVPTDLTPEGKRLLQEFARLRRKVSEGE